MAADHPHKITFDDAVSLLTLASLHGDKRMVQMLLDGHSAATVCERLGISGTNTLYRWKKEFLGRESPVAGSLEKRVRELEVELHRVEREREILKKALSIFGRSG